MRDYDIQQLRDHSLQDLQNSSEKGYDSLFQSHQEAWQNKSMECI